MVKLSILIPAYNEEKTIGIILDKVKGVKLKNVRKEIIVVDNASTDRTFDILKNDQIDIIKLIPLFDNTTKSYKAKLIDCVSNLKQKVVMIHTGWGNKSWGSGLQSEVFPELLQKFPEKIFICAHMKEDTDLDNYRRLELLNKYSNFFVETSYVPHAKRIWQ